MKNTKKININPTVFYVVSAILNIVGIVSLVGGGENHTTGIVWICLGSTFLCLGSALKSRQNTDKENEKKDDTEGGPIKQYIVFGKRHE